MCLLYGCPTRVAISTRPYQNVEAISYSPHTAPMYSSSSCSWREADRGPKWLGLEVPFEIERAWESMPTLSTQVCSLRKPLTMVTPDVRTGSYCWPSCTLCSFRAAVFLHAIYGDNPCSCLSSGDDLWGAPHFLAAVVLGKSALRLRRCAKTRDLTRRLQLPGS